MTVKDEIFAKAVEDKNFRRIDLFLLSNTLIFIHDGFQVVATGKYTDDCIVDYYDRETIGTISAKSGDGWYNTLDIYISKED